MDYGTLFIAFIIFGLLSFIIKKFSGLDIYQTYGAVSIIALLIPMLYIIQPVLYPPYNIELSIDRLTKWLINFFPGALVGDAAGVMIAKLTGEKT